MNLKRIPQSPAAALAAAAEAKLLAAAAADAAAAENWPAMHPTWDVSSNRQIESSDI